MMQKKPEKLIETLGTHLNVLSEGYPMNTNMTGFRCFFQKSLHPCALGQSIASELEGLIWPYLIRANS